MYIGKINALKTCVSQYMLDINYYLLFLMNMEYLLEWLQLEQEQH